MRKIKQTSQFKRDYKRELKGVLGKKLERLLLDVLGALVTDEPLAVKYRDHQLHGDYVDCRDCHQGCPMIIIAPIWNVM